MDEITWGDQISLFVWTTLRENAKKSSYQNTSINMWKIVRSLFFLVFFINSFYCLLDLNLLFMYIFWYIHPQLLLCNDNMEFFCSKRQKVNAAFKNQCIMVHPSLFVSVHLCNCCTFFACSLKRISCSLFSKAVTIIFTCMQNRCHGKPWKTPCKI